MEINNLKKWLDDKINKYDSVPDLFEDACNNTDISYELGRYDSYIEIREFLER